MPAPSARFLITAKDATRRAFDSVGRRLTGIKRVASGLKFGSLFGLGGAGAIGGIGALIQRQIDLIDRVGKASQKLGISTEALSQLRYAASKTEISFEQLESGLQRMVRRLAQAAQGEGEARKALDALNLSAAQLAKLRPEQQLEVLAEAMKGVANQGQRVLIAQQLFDSEGVNFLRILDKGAEGLRRSREEADALGKTICGEAAQAAAEYKDSLSDLAASAGRLGMALTQDLLPGLNKVTKGFADAASQRGLLVTLPQVAQAVVAAFGEPADALGRVERKIREVDQAIADIQSARDRTILPINAGQAEREIAELRTKLLGLLRTRNQVINDLKTQDDRANRDREAAAQATEEAADAAADAEKRATDKIKAQLAEREDAYRRSIDALKDLRAQQKSVADEFAELVRDIESDQGEAGQATPDFLDVTSTKTQAQAALNAGDTERAIELARQAGDELRQLKEESGAGSLALTGLAKQIEAVAVAAAKTRTEAKIVDVEEERRSINELRDQLKREELLLPLSVDEREAVEGAKRARDAAQRYADENPVIIRTKGGFAGPGTSDLGDEIRRTAAAEGGRP